MRKTISVCLVFVMIALVFTSTFLSSSAFLLGDIDGDGYVYAEDARMILRHSAKLKVSDGFSVSAADVNRDGKILADDARMALRMSARLEPLSTYEETKDLEITYFKYYVQLGYLMYTITIHNPNDDIVIDYPSFRIVAKSSDGSILGVEEQTLSRIYPGSDFVYSSQAFSISENPSDVTVEPLPIRKYNISNVNDMQVREYIPLTTENISAINTSNVSRITGEIKNNNAYDISCAIIVVRFFNDNGKFVGSESTFTSSSLPARSSTPFSMSIYNRIFTKNYEVYVDFWY